MILVDIQVPVLDKVYDFELDEETKVEMVLKEILALITQKEGITCEEPEKMCLYVLGQEGILPGDATLRQQGVSDGDRLLLI